MLAIFAVVMLLIVFGVIFLSGTGKDAERIEEAETENEFVPPQDFEYDENLIEDFNNAPVKVEYDYTLSSGEKITIRIPEGVDPPPQAAVEKMYRERKE